MGWSYSIGNALVAFLDLKNPKNVTEIIVLSQILPEMSWTSSMTSHHDVIASWVGRVSGHHPFSHSTHFYEHFDILYNIASRNFPRKIIFQPIRPVHVHKIKMKNIIKQSYQKTIIDVNQLDRLF